MSIWDLAGVIRDCVRWTVFFFLSKAGGKDVVLLLFSCGGIWMGLGSRVMVWRELEECFGQDIAMGLFLMVSSSMLRQAVSNVL